MEADGLLRAVFEAVIASSSFQKSTFSLASVILTVIRHDSNVHDGQVQGSRPQTYETKFLSIRLDREGCDRTTWQKSRESSANPKKTLENYELYNRKNIAFLKSLQMVNS